MSLQVPAQRLEKTQGFNPIINKPNPNMSKSWPFSLSRIALHSRQGAGKATVTFQFKPEGQTKKVEPSFRPGAAGKAREILNREP